MIRRLISPQCRSDRFLDRFDQNGRDHEALAKAAKSGKLEVVMER
jgi:hypothetical protein